MKEMVVTARVVPVYWDDNVYPRTERDVTLQVRVQVAGEKEIYYNKEFCPDVFTSYFAEIMKNITKDLENSFKS